MTIINTEHAPGAIGPYSQAIVSGNMMYLSGQTGLVPGSGEAAGETIEAQAEQCCKNIQAVLEAGGCDFTHVVKTTCFLADMGDFAAFNGIYEKYFVNKPARSCVAVKTLPKNLLCEIEAIVEL